MQTADRAPWNRTLWLPLGLIALVGITEILVATARYGIAITPDSVGYLATAHGMATGHGAAQAAVDGRWEPLRVEPPLYPALLAIPKLFGLDALHAAIIFNALFMIGTIFLSGWIVWRQTQNRCASLLAAMFMAVGPSIFVIHISAMSDAPFVFLVLGSLALLSEYLRHPGTGKLLGAGALAALAILTRFAGFALPPALCVGILCLSHQSLARRLRDVIILSALTFLSPMGWSIIHGSNGHQFAPHFLIGREWRQFSAAILNWFVPGDLPTAAAAPVAILIMGLLLATPLVLLRRSTDARQAHAAWLSWFFAMTYLAVVMATVWCFDAAVPLDKRILCPLYVAMVLLGACTIPELGLSQRLVKALAAATLLVLAVQAARIALRLPILYRNGAGGYADKIWQESPTLAWIKAIQLPSHTIIYSNIADAVAFRLGSPVVEFPDKFSPLTLHKDDDYQQHLKEIGLTKNRYVVFVMFNADNTLRAEQPTEQDLQKALSLRTLAKMRDGTIYELRNNIN